MPTATVRLTPGVASNQTPSLNQAAYQSTNLIRWDPATGLAQKIGGWTKFYSQQVDSIVRALHPFEDLNGMLHLGVGAVSSLNVITNGNLVPITPGSATDNFTPGFTTTAGSNSVKVTDTGSNATIYDTAVLKTQVSVDGIILSGNYPIISVVDANNFTINAATKGVAGVTNGGAVPAFTTVNGSSLVNVLLNAHGQALNSTFPVLVSTAVGGITLFGFYNVVQIVDANNFKIQASAAATSSTTVSENGGNAQILFYLTPNPPAVGGGYGAGGYGAGGYGSGTTNSGRAGTPITAADWSLDNWGGFLIAGQRNGPIFVWDPSSGLPTAPMIAQAPSISTGCFVSMPAQILVAYGAETLGVQDKLFIRWSTNSDYTQWTAAVTNQAGSYRIPRGSQIVGGLQGPQYGLIWTDLAVWSMSYVGQPFIFGFNQLAGGCGLIAKFAAGVQGTTVFWMSQKGFFALPSGGSVTPLPCTVWDFIFKNLDLSNLEKIRCAVNSQFGEVAWFFPTLGGGGENSAYVKFTEAFSAWDSGFLARSAWTDQSVFGPPIGALSSPIYIYQHETSNDADNVAMQPSFTTGYWTSSASGPTGSVSTQGGMLAFTDLVYPDFVFTETGLPSASIQVTFNYSDNAQDQVFTNGPFTMMSGNPGFLNVRFRARLSSMTVSSSDLGTFWRFGGLRVRSNPDGKL